MNGKHKPLDFTLKRVLHFHTVNLADRPFSPVSFSFQHHLLHFSTPALCLPKSPVPTASAPSSLASPCWQTAGFHWSASAGCSADGVFTGCFSKSCCSDKALWIYFWLAVKVSKVVSVPCQTSLAATAVENSQCPQQGHQKYFFLLVQNQEKAVGQDGDGGVERWIRDTRSLTACQRWEKPGGSRSVKLFSDRHPQSARGKMSPPFSPHFWSRWSWTPRYSNSFLITDLVTCVK